MKMKSSRMPRNMRVRASRVWSAEGKACVKSRYAIRMSLLCMCASSVHRLRYDIAREHERPARKSSFPG
jgi:hypothetical protein